MQTGTGKVVTDILQKEKLILSHQELAIHSNN